MVQRYNVSLSETLQNNAPLIEKYDRIRPNTAWFNSHIRHAKVMKRRLERKYRKSGLEADLEKYKEQCKTVKLLLTKYKTEFYSCKINPSRNDIKKLYELSKSLLGEVKQPKLPESDSDQLLAETFNKFLIDKILKIRSTIKNSLPQKDVDIKVYIHPNLEVTLKSFKPVDEDEVRKRINNSSSEKMYLNFGVPQGSVLGPILFTLYVAPVADIANKHGVSRMLYADDTRLYVEFNKSSMAASLQHLELCIDGIKSWMSQNILKLNEDKTEVIVFGSRKYLEGMPSISIRVGDYNHPDKACSQPRCPF